MFHWVPWNEPLEHRLQTLAAALWALLFFCGAIFGLSFMLYLIYNQHYWVVFLYFLWYLSDFDVQNKGGRPSPSLLNSKFLKLVTNYLQAQLTLDDLASFNPQKNYLFAAYPHGILAMGACVTLLGNHCNARTLFPSHSFRLVTIPIQFIFPIIREFMLGLGGITSSAKSIEYVLKNPKGGLATLLIVGGAQETKLNKPGDYTIFLKNRKGFVKLALKTGSGLVPVITFGETDLYGDVTGGQNFLQRFLRKQLGFSLVVPPGRGLFQTSFGIVPRRAKITTVVGKPLELEPNQNPTQEDIDLVHAQYMACLNELFEKHKKFYVQDPENTRLVIT